MLISVEFERDASNIVTLEEIMNMNMNTKNIKFDYIIGNPPYANTLHGDILYVTFKAFPESTIVWLAPHNLSWNADKGNRLQQLRDDIEPNFLSYNYIGKNFGDLKLDLEIGVFVFKPNIEVNYTFEEAMLDDNPHPIRKALLEKIYHADNHFKFNGWVSRIKDENKKEVGINHPDKQLIEKNIKHMQQSLQPNSLAFVAASGMRLFNNKERFCVKEITVENFSIGFAELLCDSKEEQEMAFNNILNNYDYRSVLRLLSTKRGFKLNRPWPKTIEDCHFTEEELAYLRKNYGDNNNETN